jgi:acyl carrier protein
VYRTGDLVRYHADGTLEWLERIDQQVKIRGFRIELGEIELALARHPQVRESAVVVHESAPGEKQLVAFLVPVPNTPPPNASEVRAYLAAQLPEYMVPATVLVLPELPLTPNSKVDRRTLAVLATAAPQETDTFVAPRTPTEQEVAAVWSEVLGIKRLGAQDNFFEAGGDSLSAVRVVVRLRDKLHVPLALQHLFEKPTLADLAAAIDRLGANTVTAPAAKLTAVPRDTRRLVLKD